MTMTNPEVARQLHADRTARIAGEHRLLRRSRLPRLTRRERAGHPAPAPRLLPTC